MNGAIAALDLVAVSRTGERRACSIRVSAPRGETEDWSCSVTVSGLLDGVAPIRGEDSLQALLLALGLVRSVLRGFVEAGGRLEYTTGEVLPLEAYFR